MYEHGSQRTPGSSPFATQQDSQPWKLTVYGYGKQIRNPILTYSILAVFRYWGPNRVLGNMGRSWLLSVKKVKTQFVKLK